MKKTILYTALSFLILTGSSCSRKDPCDRRGVICDCTPFNITFHVENKSDYGVDIRVYNGTIRVKYEIFTQTIESKTKYTYDPPFLSAGKFYLSEKSGICLYNDYDSIRIYFNKNKPNERYVTYKKETFKPRDIRNPEEYMEELRPNCFYQRYYTFTNEDYDNAEKHQNTIPTPISKCDRTPFFCRSLICY